MRILEAEGVRMELVPCGCGAVCTDEQAVKHLRDWDELLKICAFCGKPIRITEMRLNHVHKSNIDEEGWGVTYDPMEHEKSYDWSGHGPFGWFEIVAHPECAKKGMPYANLEVDEERPKRIPDGVPAPRARLGKCKTCGDQSTEDDLAEVLGQIYSYYGPCSYCGKPIEVLEVELEHGPRIKTDPHVDWWHWKNYMREASLNWWGWDFESKSHRQINFYGHLTCMMKKMPYCKWLELQQVFHSVTKGRPELADRQLWRYLSRKVAEGARKCQILTPEQIAHLVLSAVQDLEGPREWVPGLVK